MSDGPSNSDLELLLAMDGSTEGEINPLCSRLTPIFARVARLVTNDWPYTSDLKILAHVREVLRLLTAAECMIILQQTVIEDPQTA